MLNLAAFCMVQKRLTYFAAVMLALTGIFSYLNMGWLEDPDISVKTAVVIIDYPGASPEEVELEVAEVVETKLQEMSQLKHVSSLSRDGRAIFTIEIKDKYWTPELPQVWDELRRKLRDIRHALPEGARAPVVKDDYGSVYGFVVAITSDGFEQYELQDQARELRRELNLMSQVARVDLWGMQQRQIILELLPSDITEYGVSEQAMTRAFYDQNKIVDAGLLELGSRQYAVNISGELKSLDDIRNLLVMGTTPQGGQQLIRLGDVAKLHYAYQSPPANLFRVNGLPAIALAIAPTQGSNIVNVGKALDSRLQALQKNMLVGLNIEKVAWQSDYVANAVNNFMLSLGQATVIVFLVLSLTMGLRMGLLIGGVGLGLTVLGSITLMNVSGVDLHRVSLGSLIVAMGMMVDNAIVVADGFVVRVKKGMSRSEAAIEAAGQPGMPLLGATLVAVMAFYPVFGADAGAAEYARALFIVVGLSLMLSWVISQTIIPLLCVKMIPVDTLEKSDRSTVGRGLVLFRQLVSKAIRYRFVATAFLMLTFVAAIAVYPQVNKEFFPEAERNQFLIDYWAHEGTRLSEVAAGLEYVETFLQAEPAVSSVSSFMGQGAPRFYLPVNPELPNSSYAQLLVTTDSADSVDSAIKNVKNWLANNAQEGDVQIRKFGVGAAPKWPIEIRVVGPANADKNTLRRLAEEVKIIMRQHPHVSSVVDDWRQRHLRIHSLYSQQEGHWTGIRREDVARAIKGTVDGSTVGALRKGDEQHHIVVRTNDQSSSDLLQVQVRSFYSDKSVPLSQITKETPWQWYDPIISHYDLRRTITVQALPDGGDATTISMELEPLLQQMNLPDGYQIKLAGEYQLNNDSRQSLIDGVPLALSVMAFIVVSLFNAYRPSLIIFAVVPFTLIGVFFGHYLSGVALGFISVLGIFSLSGMVIKNAVVLIDEVNNNKTHGLSDYDALLEAAESRFLPVFNASLTTVLGMLPLLQDVFWQSMAVTIIFGLVVGTLITMIFVPVFYAILYRVKCPG